MRLVVDVQPLAVRILHLLDQSLYQGFAEAAALVRRVDDRVEQECVLAAVPAGVDEADERFTVEGANPGETVPAQPARPRRDLAHAIAEGSGMQVGQLLVLDREADSEFSALVHAAQHCGPDRFGYRPVGRFEQIRSEPLPLFGRTTMGLRLSAI